MIERPWRLIIAVLFLLLPGVIIGGQADRNPAAVVNGESISLKQVEDAASEDLARLDLRKAQFEVELKRDRESALEDALEGLLRDRVLAAEAAKRKVSVEDLIAIAVDSAVVQPTDEAIVQFYNTNKSGLDGSLADNVVAIRGYLRDQSRQAVFDGFLHGLRKSYGAMSYMEPQRSEIALYGRPSKGPADAPVTVVEFSDFECPYCRALFPTLQKIASDYQDKVRIVYFQFPLADIHKHALKASEASLCALEQGKFWQMHDAMFSDQMNLTVEGLKEKASKLSLDSKAFDACLDSGKHFANVRSDVSEGSKAGVTGTPALFINGRFLVGNQPYGEIQRIVEDELRRAAAK